MFMSGGSVTEKSLLARGLRVMLAQLSALGSRFRAALRQASTGMRDRGHLQPRPAERLSAFSARRNRLKIGAAAAFVVGGAVVASLALRGPAALPLNNAIWLDRDWTYGDLDDDILREVSERFIENQIGTAYVYVSSLGMDNQWSGGSQGNRGFQETRPLVEEFAEAVKRQNDRLRLYGWIEVWTHLDKRDGYRLDDDELHRRVADFSRLLAGEIGFDGVLLDVKPLFRDSNDFIRLLRRVRSALGSEVPIAVAVAADLQPEDPRLRALETVAPGTMWSSSFKKQVMVSADEIVLPMYQSYRQSPRDYVNWVAYHVEAYVNELETSTKVLVSIPNYGGASPAHNPAIETMENALAGVREGLSRLEEDKRARLTGIAIYSDGALRPSDWSAFRESWLQR